MEATTQHKDLVLLQITHGTAVLQLEAHSDDTLKSVKDRLELQLKIPHRTQTIYFSGLPLLRDEATLRSLGIGVTSNSLVLKTNTLSLSPQRGTRPGGGSTQGEIAQSTLTSVSSASSLSASSSSLSTKLPDVLSPRSETISYTLSPPRSPAPLSPRFVSASFDASELQKPSLPSGASGSPRRPSLQPPSLSSLKPSSAWTSSLSSTPPAVPTSDSKRGYLHKRGEINTSWKQRWFVLVDDKLHYFKSANHSTPIATIVIRDAHVLPLEKMQGEERYPFQLITKSRVYSLYATSASDMLEWVQKIDEKTVLNVDNQLIAIAEERLMALQQYRAAKGSIAD